MPDLAKRLYGPAAPGTGLVTAYTTPANTVTIFRYLRAVNNSGTDYTFSAYLGPQGANTTLWSGITVPGLSLYEWAGWIPLAAGEFLTVTTSNVNVVLTLAGVEVT